MWDGEVDRVEQEVLQAGLELTKAPLPHSKEKKKKRKSRGKRVADQIRKFKDSNDPAERQKLEFLRWERSTKGGKAERKRPLWDSTRQLAEPKTEPKNESTTKNKTEPKTESTESNESTTTNKTEPKTESTEPKNEHEFTETKNESTEDRVQDPQAERDAKSEPAHSESLPGSPVAEVASGSARLSAPWAPWPECLHTKDEDTSSDDSFTKHCTALLAKARPKEAPKRNKPTPAKAMPKKKQQMNQPMPANASASSDSHAAEPTHVCPFSTDAGHRCVFQCRNWSTSPTTGMPIQINYVARVLASDTSSGEDMD